jgi:hypothetical protein
MIKKFDIKIKWYKSPKSIRVSMTNPWPGSWGRTILIEIKKNKNKKALSSTNIVLKDEIEKQ